MMRALTIAIKLDTVNVRIETDTDGDGTPDTTENTT